MTTSNNQEQKQTLSQFLEETVARIVAAVSPTKADDTSGSTTPTPSATTPVAEAAPAAKPPRVKLTVKEQIEKSVESWKAKHPNAHESELAAFVVGLTTKLDSSMDSLLQRREQEQELVAKRKRLFQEVREMGGEFGEYVPLLPAGIIMVPGGIGQTPQEDMYESFHSLKSAVKDIGMLRDYTYVYGLEAGTNSPYDLKASFAARNPEDVPNHITGRILAAERFLDGEVVTLPINLRDLQDKHEVQSKIEEMFEIWYKSHQGTTKSVAATQVESFIETETV